MLSIFCKLVSFQIYYNDDNFTLKHICCSEQMELTHIVNDILTKTSMYSLKLSVMCIFIDNHVQIALVNSNQISVLCIRYQHLNKI